MVKKELLDNVNKLGVPLMMLEEKMDVNETLAQVVKSQEVRLWENFPALLALAVRKYDLDFSSVSQKLTSSGKKVLNQLVALTKVLHDDYHVTFAELEKCLKDFSKGSLPFTNHLNSLRKEFKQSSAVDVGGSSLSTERLKLAFEDYLSRGKMQEQKEQDKHKELSVEYALSQVFSPKQKELFYKKLNNEPLSKTEREYFSRTVKKKVVALGNGDLHSLAQRILHG